MIDGRDEPLALDLSESHWRGPAGAALEHVPAEDGLVLDRAVETYTSYYGYLTSSDHLSELRTSTRIPRLDPVLLVWQPTDVLSSPSVNRSVLPPSVACPVLSWENPSASRDSKT
jgi:hypothetical protein